MNISDAEERYTIKKLNAEIEKLEEKYISVWEDVCNIESQTSDKEGVDKVCEFIDKNVCFGKWYYGHSHKKCKVDDKHEFIYDELVQI